MIKITPFTKWTVILNCAVPATLLGWDALQGQLGANPVNFAIRTTGALGLLFLVLTLGVTPLMQLAGWNWLGQFRRVAGLCAFFYTLLHFSLFFLFDRAANVGDTVREIVLRPYLMVGSVGLAIMVPLAATSTNNMIRWIGTKRWKTLHRFTYLVAIAGAVHYYMLVKADTSWPVAFGSAVVLLLGYRVAESVFNTKRKSAPVLDSSTSSPTRNTGAMRPWAGKLRVEKITLETPQVRTFRLVPLEASTLPFQFSPGQFLVISVEIDGKKVRRSYTISSSASQTAYCELTIKRESNGLVSRHMHDSVRVGDVVEVTAPAGKFTFDGQGADQIVMIAGGVGITPLMSKIRYLTERGWSGSIRLIYSVRCEEDIIFRRELESLQERHANLSVTITLTGDENSPWRGERGRISRALVERVAPQVTSGLVHLCGPTEMTRPLIEMLQELGVARDKIRSEAFTSPSRKLSDGSEKTTSVTVSEQEVDPSVNAGEPELELQRSRKVITQLKGQTILEAAENVGVNIPYDCRSGVCGQCQIRLLSGRVKMDSHDALTPAEIASGLILACQARCIDRVVVEA